MALCRRGVGVRGLGFGRVRLAPREEVETIASP